MKIKRENLRRERRRLQEQLRRVRRQDRLQQHNTPISTNTTIDHHSPSSRSTNPSPIRNAHLQLNNNNNNNNNNDLSSIKLPNESDLLIKNDINIMDDNHPDLFMDNNHNITSTSQLISTAIDNLNSNSQSSFAHYFNSITLPTISTDSTAAAATTTTTTTIKRRKKSEKDLKSVGNFLNDKDA